MRRLPLILAAAFAASAVPLAAQTVPEATDRIIDEGANRSEVMRIAQYLTDVIGPRLTNSPGMRRAEDWTQAKFREWGLANVHKEGFEFGRGWSADAIAVRMVSPRAVALTAIPVAWSPGTGGGAITAPIAVAPMADEAAFAQYKGKLKGRIVLISDPADPTDPDQLPFRRWSAEELAKFDAFELPNAKPTPRAAGSAARFALARKRDAFLKEEGALAYAIMSSRGNKLIHGQGSQFGVGESPALPGVELAAEDYRRLVRLDKMGAAPVVELTAQVRYDDSDTKAYNILADLPGSDPRGGYVMAGAHMDSWAAGDGAADNAAGVAVVMEAARILKAMGVKPKRTIRFALWAGEEQGLLGSMSYVEQHLATRPVPADLTGVARYMGWSRAFPITPKPEHAKLAAYFNIDNGSGRIRGINAQQNSAVVPIFREWLAPFASMGASTVSIRKVGSTDHAFFDAVGIPAFQFIQDPLDYGSTVHHTNADTFDHLRAEDMRQNAIILAYFLLQAANSDKPLPRVPLAQEPVPSDGFYPAPGAAH